MMQAVRVHEGGELRSESVDEPTPGPGEVLVELRAAALNRRDLLVCNGTYPFPLPLVPGSDGAGIRRDTGEEVVINPALAWGSREEAPGPDFQILGGPQDGTYAELVAVPEANLFPKPKRLTWEEAAGNVARRADGVSGAVRPRRPDHAARPCSSSAPGAASRRSSCSSRPRPERACSSPRRRTRRSSDRVALGAEGGVNYASSDWVAAVKELGGVDLVIDSVGSTWPQSLECLRRGGRLVVFGATGGTEATLAVRPLYMGHQSLLGTQMGSPSDYEGFLSAVGRGSWRPVVDSIYPLADAATALQAMGAGAHFGKLVLTCS